MKLLFSLICTLLFVLSIVTAADDHAALTDVVASTNANANREEEPPQQHATANRRKRVRRTVAVDATSTTPTTNEVVDPFSNYMVLAESEDALLRALNDKAYSVPPPKSKPGVSTSTTTAARR